MQTKAKWITNLALMGEKSPKITWSTDDESTDDEIVKIFTPATQDPPPGPAIKPNHPTTSWIRIQPDQPTQYEINDNFSQSIIEPTQASTLRAPESSPTITEAGCLVTAPSPVINNRTELLKSLRGRLKGRKAREADADSPAAAYRIETSPSPPAAPSSTGSGASRSNYRISDGSGGAKRARRAKGGRSALGHELRKAVHLQRGRVAIWQHEVFTRKVNAGELEASQAGKKITFVVEVSGAEALVVTNFNLVKTPTSTQWS